MCVDCDSIYLHYFSQPGRSPSKRGVGVQFGPDVTETFCRTNDIGKGFDLSKK